MNILFSQSFIFLLIFNAENYGNKSLSDWAITILGSIIFLIYL